jgi:hypothetical protein
MSHLWILAALVLLPLGVRAAPPPARAGVPEANLKEGGWTVGGFVEFTQNAGRAEDASAFQVSVSASRFIADGFALGASGGLDGATGLETVASVGPLVSYYLWSGGRLAPYVSGGIRFGLTEATVNNVLQGIVGLEYFLVPSVAVGPSFFFNHYNSDFTDYQRYGFTLNLGVYL